MKSKIYLIKILIVVINIVVVWRLYDICIVNHEKYEYLSSITNEKIIESNTTLRGRILDCKGNVLVDNKGIKVLYYTKIPEIKLSE